MRVQWSAKMPPYFILRGQKRASPDHIPNLVSEDDKPTCMPVFQCLSVLHA